MEILDQRAFNRRKFVSIGLLMTAIVLVITAVAIQIFEEVEDDFCMHLFFGTHIFTGIAFTVLAVLHAKLNWQSMKSYIKNKELSVSREAIYAFLLTMAIVLTAFMFVCLEMY
jgi:ABC-type Mn2+/Zn2+ transport system permease subunit